MKRVKSCLMASALVLANIVLGVDVAQIEGGEKYSTLEAAVAAVPDGGTIQMLVAGVDEPFPSYSAVKAFTIKGLQDGYTCITGTVEMARFAGWTENNVTFENINWTQPFCTRNMGNVTFRHCKFTGENGVRYAYAFGGPWTFTNCVFEQTGVYAAHFDKGDVPVSFIDCSFRGKVNGLNADNTTSSSFVNCTFDGGANGEPYTAEIKMRANTSFKDCTFTEKFANGILAANNKDDNGINIPDGFVYTFENCVIVNSAATLASLVGAVGTGSAAVVDGTKVESAYTAGTFVTSSMATLNNLLAVDVTGMDGLTGRIEYTLSGDANVLKAAAWANGGSEGTHVANLSGTLQVPAGVAFSVASDATVTAGTKVYLSGAQGGTEYTAFVDSLTATQAANLTVYGTVAKIGTTAYYSLKDAISAVTSSDTIEMIADATLDSSINSDHSFTLDLNGFAVDGDNKYGFVLSGSAVTIKDSSSGGSGRIVHCTKSGTGDGLGAIKYSGSGVLTLESGSICSNTAAGDSGVAVFMSSGDFVMNGGKIFENVNANGYGGAVGQSSGTFTLNDGAIFANRASNRGGAVSLGTNGKMVMNGGSIVDNETTSQGGAVHLANGDSEFTMNGGVISGNVASSHGGGVGAELGTIRINGGLIANNRTTGGWGGGVFVASGASRSLVITGGVISNNTAKGSASGDAIASWVDASGGHFSIESSTNVPVTVYGTVSVTDAGTGIDANISCGRFNSAFENNYTRGAFITGGVFTDAAKPLARMIPMTSVVVANTDEVTKVAYPWMIGPDTTNVAYIGTEKYATVAEAMAAAQSGDTVTLLKDTDEAIVLKGGVTLNVNGKEHGALTSAEGYTLKDNGDGTYSTFLTVARIGAREYPSVQEALNAATNETVVLVAKDWTENWIYINRGLTNTLDLGGQVLTAHFLCYHGNLTVENGTIENLGEGNAVFHTYGSSDYAMRDTEYSVLNVAESATILSEPGYGVIIWGAQDYSALPFGLIVNVAGTIESGSPIFVAGGVGGPDTYYASTTAAVQASGKSTETLRKSVNELLALYGPELNILEGAYLDASGDEVEESFQGISMNGYARVTVSGGTVTGEEGVGVKAGALTVTGGRILATGEKCDPIQAVNSGTEPSGGAVSVTTYYNGNSPIVVKVTGGTLQSMSNAALIVAHSYESGNPVPVNLGVSVSVAGGTFIGGSNQKAVYAEAAVAADGNKFPTGFIVAEKDNVGNETGYPLFNTTLNASDIAVGYKEKDNKNGTWTVTAGSAEIKVVIEDVTPEVTIDPNSDVTEAEAGQAATNVLESLNETLSDPANEELVGTGIEEAMHTGTGTVEQYVVDALKDAAETEEEKAQITEDITISQHVEVKLDDVKVTVTSSEETGSRLVTATTTSITYEIKPIVTTTITTGNETKVIKAEIVEGTPLSSPVTFRVWLEDSFIGDYVSVQHISSNEVVAADSKIYQALTEDGKRYIDVTWSSFCELVGTVANVSGKACLADGRLFDTVAEALADPDMPTDATITLLANCSETSLALLADQKIELNDYEFTGSLAPVDGMEKVEGRDGTVYLAPVAVEVNVDDSHVMSIRGYAFPSGVDTDAAKKAHLEGTAVDGGLKRWQAYVLGVDESTKLLPKIDKAAIEGSSTVVIRAQDAFTVSTPAKCGVAVKFNLLYSTTGESGSFVKYDAVENEIAEPYFELDVTELSSQTFWKIQMVFESTEVSQ